MQEENNNYREFSINKNKVQILRDSSLSFAKDSALLLMAALAYRKSKNPVARTLALFAGGRAIKDATSRLLFAKPLLLINEV